MCVSVMANIYIYIPGISNNLAFGKHVSPRGARCGGGRGPSVWIACVSNVSSLERETIKEHSSKHDYTV